MVAPNVHSQLIARHGVGLWMGAFSVVSLVGFFTIAFGYGLARDEATEVFEPANWSRTLLIFTMPVAFVLLISSQLPAGWIKKKLRHPMMIGVLLWATAHLLANGDMASLVLFAGFSIWSAVYLLTGYSSSSPAPKTISVWPDIAAIVAGLGLTWLTVTVLHQWLIGVPVI